MSEGSKPRILVVDDEVQLADALCEMLPDHGFEVAKAYGADQAIKLMERRSFDILLSDLMMPGTSGMELLRHAFSIDPSLAGIMMTGHGTIATAVEAMKVGAFDYVLKPFNLKTVLPVLRRAAATRLARQAVIRRQPGTSQIEFESARYELVGDSQPMQRVKSLIRKTAGTDATVLVRGATGTGKELVARAIHFNSARRSHPLVTINCAALQETLLESELFGHEKGAFTGASNAKPGLVEVADGGTLFIDEVAEMAPGLQAKLLRVLEDGHYRRVGSNKENRADVRVIAATNKHLAEEQRAGRFREDLFYRLNVITIELPPLNQRRDDIPPLAEHFLATRSIGDQRHHLRQDTLDILMRYDWPGNVRELANVLERAQTLTEGTTITPDDLPDHMLNFGGQPYLQWTESMPPSATAPERSLLKLEEVEQQTVSDALQRAGGNKTKAAALLGISRRALYRLIEKYNLEQTVTE